MKFLLTLTITTLLMSCSTVSDFFEDNKYYYKSGYQRVQLDVESERVKNIHPIKIDSQRVEGALKLVLTTFGSKPQQLFPNNKVSDYAIAISEALLEAQSNEDVVFTIEGWYKQKGLSANRVTSGRIFYNKTGLNLIFGSILRKGNMSETDPMVSAGINPDLKKNPYAPGSRFQTINNKFRLSALPNSGVFRPSKAKTRKDWLVFTNQALKARSFLNRQEQTTALRSNIGVQDLRNEVQSLRNELKSLRSPYQPRYGNYYPPNYRQTPYDMNSQQPYPNYQNQYQGYYQQNPVNMNTIQSSQNQLTLKSLESMRERGLISEENYLKKLKELGY